MLNKTKLKYGQLLYTSMVKETKPGLFLSSSSPMISKFLFLCSPDPLHFIKWGLFTNGEELIKMIDKYKQAPKDGNLGQGFLAENC